MFDWSTVGVSLVTSIVVAWITSKIAFRADIKKYLHSKRESMYFELYSSLDCILMNHELIYDDGYKKDLYRFKPGLKLIASIDVIDAYKKIIQLCYTYEQKLKEFCSINDPLNNEDAYERMYDEFGNEEEICHGNEYECESEKYEKDLRRYKLENTPSTKELQDIINEITNAMRKDIGSKKIRW